MSKQKVIVLSVTEQGLSISEAARRYGVSRRWVHVLIRRYRDGGTPALAPRSRRPHHNSRRAPAPTTDRILSLRRELTAAGLDAGPVTIAWHLTREGITAPSTSTIRRILHAAGLVSAAPRKRPKSSLHRFEAAQPNETWQSDFTRWPLADGTDTEILNFLDDDSRYLLACTAYRPVTGAAVSETFLKTANQYRAAGLHPDRQRPGLCLPFRRRQRRPQQLREPPACPEHHAEKRIPGPPADPGKDERFPQTLKKWLSGRPRAETLQDLNAQLEKFRHIYNHERPHRARDRQTPAQAYNATVKAVPMTARQGGHWRVRVDRIDATGKVSLRHIGLGRAYAGKHILMLIHEQDIVITETATGEILRELTLDPSRDYQPRQKKTPRSEDRGVTYVATHPETMSRLIKWW